MVTPHKICTKTGDSGQTGLGDGSLVAPAGREGQ
jgi:cob(I)alamin adenosyltransferase